MTVERPEQIGYLALENCSFITEAKQKNHKMEKNKDKKYYSKSSLQDK